MVKERTERFKIDARTVELDPRTSQPVATGTNGETRYHLWSLVSRELYHANVGNLAKGIYDLGVSLDDIWTDFNIYRNSQSLHGPELELGVAAVFSVDSNKGFRFLHKDIGIWVRVPESRKVTMEDRLSVMRGLSRH